MLFTCVAALRVSSVKESRLSLTTTVLCSLCPLILIAVFVACIYWLYRQRTQRFVQQQRQPCTADDSPVSSLLGHTALTPACSPVTCSDARLVEVKARGRFGTLWKAQLSSSETVAVKVFPVHGRQSWMSEQLFYALPRVSDCPNILQFIGAESRDAAGLWLITEYHDVGSLGGYLKCHTLSLGQLASVAVSVTNGLSFLHADVDSKPSVAHRDIKSQNVLLRRDMSACIADFGLALILDGQSSDAFPQVCHLLCTLS